LSTYLENQIKWLPSSSPWAIPSYVSRRTKKKYCKLITQLDIQVAAEQGQQYLEKYDLKSNDAILAEEKHMPM
jgi:hypothetical protein